MHQTRAPGPAASQCSPARACASSEPCVWVTPRSRPVPCRRGGRARRPAPPSPAGRSPSRTEPRSFEISPAARTSEAFLVELGRRHGREDDAAPHGGRGEISSGRRARDQRGDRARLQHAQQRRPPLEIAAGRATSTRSPGTIPRSRSNPAQRAAVRATSAKVSRSMIPSSSTNEGPSARRRRPSRSTRSRARFARRARGRGARLNGLMRAPRDMVRGGGTGRSSRRYSCACDGGRESTWSPRRGRRRDDARALRGSARAPREVRALPAASRVLYVASGEASSLGPNEAWFGRRGGRDRRRPREAPPCSAAS